MIRQAEVSEVHVGPLVSYVRPTMVVVVVVVVDMVSVAVSPNLSIVVACTCSRSVRDEYPNFLSWFLGVASATFVHD